MKLIEQQIKKQDLSLLALNYAFQNTFTWGNLHWLLTEDDLESVRDCIVDGDITITGKNLWDYYHNKTNKRIYTFRTYFEMGTNFNENLIKYYEKTR